MAKKEEIKNEWRQLDVDLMLWHYCVGLLELSNIADAPYSIGLLNGLIKERNIFLNKTFKVSTSFTVVADIIDDRRIQLIKKPA